MAAGLLLIDGNSCILRSRYAISPQVGAKGRFKPLLRQFIALILRHIRSEKPVYAAVLFEDPVLPVFSNFKRLLQAAGIPTVQIRGIQVAQLALTLVAQARHKGLPATLVTARTSLLQLVRPDICLINPARDGLRFDPERVKALYGVAPERIPDWLSLTGDPAERIPGVKGIGAKTAAELLRGFASLDLLLASSEKLPPRLREQILASLDRIRRGREAASIPSMPVRGLDLDSCRLSSPEANQLLSAFSKEGLTDLLSEWIPHRHPENVAYRVVLSQEDLASLAAQLRLQKSFAIDTETTGLDPIQSQLVGISISFEPHTAYYLPVGHQYPGAPQQLPISLMTEVLGPILANSSQLKIGQNLKFDLLVLEHAGLPLKGPIFDTMVASYVLHPDNRSHSLDALALTFLDYKMIPIQELIGKEKGMQEVEMDKVTEYACEDADVTLQLYLLLAPQLEESGLARLFRQVEMPLLLALTHVEGQGLLMDPDRAKALEELAKEKAQELAEEIFSIAGGRFDLASPKMIRQILGKHLGLKPGYRTRTKAFSVSQSSLEKMADRHPIVPKLIQYQDWIRLVREKLSAFSSRVDPESGRVRLPVHPVATGAGGWKAYRLDERLRSIVKAPPGFLLLQALLLHLREQVTEHWSRKVGLRQILLKAKRTGRVFTLLGRVRSIPELNSPNPVVRQAAETEALETVLQGSVSDLLKLAFVRVWQVLQEQAPHCRIVLVEPEGFLLELPEEKLAEVAMLVKKSIEQGSPLSVPLKVHLSSGPTFSELTEVSFSHETH